MVFGASEVAKVDKARSSERRHGAVTHREVVAVAVRMKVFRCIC